MDLSKYDGKHVQVTDKWKKTFTGMAEYANHDFLECEYRVNEKNPQVKLLYVRNKEDN